MSQNGAWLQVRRLHAGDQGKGSLGKVGRKKSGSKEVQAWYSGTKRHMPLPEKHSAVDPKAAVPEIGEGNR